MDVELSMIVRGFPGAKVCEINVEPSLLNWAPFIGRATRIGGHVFNTEHRKVKAKDGQIEEHCREITEERLLEMLQQSTVKDAKAFARSLGLYIMNIKKAIGKNDNNFKKAFSKLWGCSGGWASATCPHGVVYALKFLLGFESPRDYIDMLLSMKYQPNITVVDVANIVAKHGNNRKKGMFHPFTGMVAEPTLENVEMASAGQLDVSFDWMDTPINNVDKSVEYHPVTGTSEHYALFDRCHEGNCQDRKEVLRRVTHV